MIREQTDVLIVGAGPTGLALAVALQQAGIDHLVIDKLEQGHNTSRAAVVHAHTLEMLDRLGVAAPLGGEGIALHDFTVRDRDRALLRVEFDQLPSAFRHILMVPQNITESVLHDRLVALGGRVHSGRSALRAEAHGDGARVTISDESGERMIHARYVVGADGMHSVVREAAGIGFQGEAYGESFLLADVEMDWPLRASEVSLYFSPAGLVVVAPLPGGTFRIVATVSQAPEQPGIADIQQLLDARGPTGSRAMVRRVVWGSRFRVHHRLADRYPAGPFLLIGDAAHVHSPAGGQGMNTGLVDAVVLGEALIRVIGRGEPASLLDDYATLRRAAAGQVLALASRLTRIATMRSRLLRIARNLMLRLLDRLPRFKRGLSLGLSGLSRRKLSKLPIAAKSPAVEMAALRPMSRKPSIAPC